MSQKVRCRVVSRAVLALCATLLLLGVLGSGSAFAQEPPQEVVVEDDMVQLDFNDVELSVVIDTIARLTGKNFIYDDRVRGRVTIVSPTKISLEAAYTVFESVLQVKGFTTVQGPGGAMKVIPIREAKESNIETIRGTRKTPQSDRFITRLIPLHYIDAESITNTLKPLVSKDASMVAYPPTNTVILTDAASNISRILAILSSIDVETYKEELTVIKVRHADATTLATQLSEIFGAETTAPSPRQRVRARRAAAAATPATTAEGVSKGRVRILTDERTNSLIVLASRQRMAELREVVRRLDVPVTGGGRIHVYYLRNADAEELAATLTGLLSGQPGGGAGQPGQATPQALRAAITELSEGVMVTADAPTNSLVIQASQEGYATISQVVALLDIPRPQVLVEALIMEVDVGDSEDLGFNGLARIFRGNSAYTIGSITDVTNLPPGFSNPPGLGPIDPPDPVDPPLEPPSALSSALLGPLLGSVADSLVSNFVAAGQVDTTERDPETGEILGGSLIQGIITASATIRGTEILSAPHILTMDNEEAEIKVGDNIPIVTSRVQSAAGVTAAGTLATSQNIERQDIGITLRVTPQISEGDNLRLKIFQEITDVNLALSLVTSGGGNVDEIGVSLSKRTVENTVVVADDETVVIGGLISTSYQDSVNKVPWLGDIPFLGWLFKTTSRNITKKNLLIFLTPHIVRNAEELEYETIRKREEFWERSEGGIGLTSKEKEEQEERRSEAEAVGMDFTGYSGPHPVRGRLLGHSERYPLERMLAIEEERDAALERTRAEADAEARAPRYGVLAGTFRDEGAAAATLQQLLDAGYDGTLVSGDSSGTVLFEVRLGPFSELDEAQTAADVVSDGFDLTPTVIVEEENE